MFLPCSVGVDGAIIGRSSAGLRSAISIRLRVMTRIVTRTYRPKRAPRKRKSVTPTVPVIVSTARRTVAGTPVADEPATARHSGDSRMTPVPAVVATASRKRAKLPREERPQEDDPKADARVRAFFARMIRPP
jgi:hypothetical protein